MQCDHASAADVVRATGRSTVTLTNTVIMAVGQGANWHTRQKDEMEKWASQQPSLGQTLSNFPT